MVAATLVAVVGFPGLSAAIPWPIVNPIPPPKNGWGTVNVFVLNNTSQDVTLTASTNNNANCPANLWVNSAGSGTGGTSPPLPPGQTGEIQMTSSVCGGSLGTFMPVSSDGAFTIGLYGSAQFKFASDWTANGNFENFLFEGGYTGGGNTGGLYEYNCGNGQLLGSGSPGTSVRYEYAYGTDVCFVAEPGGYTAP